QLHNLLEELESEPAVFPISAKMGDGVDELMVHLQSYLVEGPQYYPPGMVTDQPERVIAAEMIREKALKHLGKEVPHGIGVIVERIESDEQKDLVYIDA